jgi:phytanoyl-CoA hydroxylase
MHQVRVEAERMYQEGLKHHATYRDRNLLFEVLDDPRAGRRVVLQAHWTPWISPYFERLRRNERYFRVLEPFLGRDIRHIAHQIHWKPPGAKYTFYRYHPDARFRNAAATRNMLEGTVTTGLAIDRQTAANGALRVNALAEPGWRAAARLELRYRRGSGGCGWPRTRVPRRPRVRAKGRCSSAGRGS